MSGSHLAREGRRRDQPTSSKSRDTVRFGLAVDTLTTLNESLPCEQMLPPPAANFSSQRFRVQIRIACELRPVDYHTAAKRLRRSCDNAMPWAQALAVLTNPIYARHSPWISRAASPDNDDGGDGGGASASTTSEGAAEQANLRGLPLFYVGDIHSVVERDERGRVAPSVRNSIYFMWDLFMLYDVFQVYRSMYAAWKPFKRAFRETTELVGCKRALERSGTIQTAAGLKALLSPDGAASDGNMPLCMLHGRIALQASAAATASASATDGALRQAVLKFETVEKCWRPFHPLFGLFSSGERPAGGVASSRGGRSTYLRETLSTSLDEDIKAFKVVDGTGEVVLPLQHVLKCPEKIDFTTLGCEVKASSIGPSSITKVGPLNHVPHVEYTKGALLEGTDVTLVGRFGASPAIVTASAPNSSGGGGAIRGCLAAVVHSRRQAGHVHRPEASEGHPRGPRREDLGAVLDVRGGGVHGALLLRGAWVPRLWRWAGHVQAIPQPALFGRLHGPAAGPAVAGLGRRGRHQRGERRDAARG